MSGFNGILSLTGAPVCRRNLGSVSGGGGCDASVLWTDGKIGFSHQVQWTTPESSLEHLPLVRIGLAAMTGDARIDNRAEILASLGLHGHLSDGEIVVEAYLKWGERCVEKLVGDFAFAVWDWRNDLLFCARDAMGVKPFYYAHTPSEFAFASHARALLTLKDVDGRLNVDRLADVISHFLEDKTSTAYRGILRLPPGHCITIRGGRLTVRRYWSIYEAPDIRFPKVDDYPSELLVRFQEAVRCRLRTPSPVCAALSGGLDSSSIVCMARKLLGSRAQTDLHSFSAVFPGLPGRSLKKIDERPFIESVVATGGFQAHFVRGDELDPFFELASRGSRTEGPPVAPNAYLHLAMFQATQAEGGHVFLDGLDGDSVISHGFERLPDLLRTGRWITLTRELRTLASRWPSSPGRLFRRHVLAPFVSAASRRLRGQAGFEQILRSCLINPRLAAKSGLAERMARLDTGAVSADHKHRAGLNSGLFPAALEMMHGMASAYAIEVRFPFLDRRLLEFCVGIPADQKLRGGWPRSVLRRATVGILPEKVRWRFNKADLSPNFVCQFRKHSSILLSQMMKNLPRMSDFFDIRALQGVRERYCQNPAQHSADALPLFTAIVVSQWLETEKFI